jgi:predicted HTH transcriptional regulator
VDLKISESLTLDYKRSDALAGPKKDIAKDVSAFANSAGGRIVYGVIEQGHEPITVDDGVDPSEYSREWLEEVIRSNVSPRIQSLLIKQIPLPSGRVSYVLDIPAATSLAPHQAADKRYYKRFNFQSVPMESLTSRIGNT